MADSSGVDNQITAPSPEEIEAVVKSVPSTKPMTTPVEATSVPPAQPLPVLSTDPESVVIPPPVQTNIALANTPEVAQTEPVQSDVFLTELVEKIKSKAPKVVGIVLTLQSLQGLLQQVSFILVDYPALEQKLVAHQITETEVKELVITAVITFISVMVSLIFAMRLTFVKSTAGQRMKIVIGVLLFLGNAYLHNLLEALRISELLVGFFTTSVQTLNEAPQKAIENVPFLEQNVSGELNTVWYK